MTTRKASALAAATLAAAGCATRGPLELYWFSAASSDTLHATGEPAVADAPSFLKPGETLTGFAYDPFTDHFFLRLAPGNRIRVVDRPARKIKREFEVADPAPSGGDLAVRPRDGHVFLLEPKRATILEITRLGETVRRFPLDPALRPAVGIAYDPTDDALLVACDADADRATQYIARCDTRGHVRSTIQLDHAIGPSLGFDSDRREMYAPLLPAGSGIGVLSAEGKLVRTVAADGSFVDAGPHSFLRVF